MPGPRLLRIYLDPATLQMAREGSFGFAAKVQAAFRERGFRVDYVRDTDEERLKSAGRRGYALFLMKDPFHDNALSMRRAYYYPFWRIERTAQRWDFKVARKTYDEGEIDTDLAQDWFGNWRRYLFGKAPLTAARTGMIYVPLQGRLRDHRSFQTMSPLDMIAEVRAHAGKRHILLALHPGETYTPDEISAVEKIAAGDPRVSLQTGGMEEALRLCDLVVTQNSAAALSGFFFEKPAVLFAKTDFHHQMPAVSNLGVDEAFRQAQAIRPAFAEYLYWFIQLNAIKADTDEAEARIVETVRQHGWEV